MTRRYPATLMRVVDGDTIHALVDLGFYVKAEICLRLARINCPEVGSELGPKAKAFTEEWFSVRPKLIVETAKGDRYGRWIAEVYEAPTGTTVDPLPLSTRLIMAGLAEPYPKVKGEL
jgi:endonuclease YncB( thermonuclease family)